MKRRELLKAAAALPLAGLACGRKPKPWTFGGAIVGPDVSLGHRLRDGGIPAPERFEAVDVVVVGAGAAGLAAAWRLKDAGLDLRVLEMEPVHGGTARSGRNEVSAFPWGAHYLPAPTKENPALVRLLQEAGVVEGFHPDGEPFYGEQFLVRAPEERIFAHGQWWEGLYLHVGASAEDERQLRAFLQEVDRLSAWRDARGRRAFALPRSQASDAPEVRALDRLSFAQWLDARGLGSPRLRWLLDYGCRDDYGLRLEQTSAWAGLLYFAARKAAPGQESQPLLAWPEGNGFLVNHLAGTVKAQLRTGVAVARVVPGPRVKVHALDAATRRPLGFEARRVIFAGPQFIAGAVVEGYREARGTAVEAFRHSPWLVANLTLEDRPKEANFPLAWDNVIRDSQGLGYVVATHQALKDYGPTVWTYYRPFTGADDRAERAALLAMDWKACAQLVLEDLKAAHPNLAARLRRLDVVRWGHAMVRPTPGFCWSADLEAARAPFGGVHFAHTELSALALFEEAFDHGLRAAEEVLGALGKRRD